MAGSADAAPERRRKQLSLCLITPFSVVDFVDAELTTNSTKSYLAGNVGILSLAAALRENGCEAHLVNLDLLFLNFLARENFSFQTEYHPFQGLAVDSDRPTKPAPSTSSHFFEAVAEHLKSLSFDIFGFGSICSSYPLTLRLAREVKRLNPNSLVILGGPQASVVDVATMRAFPFVDFVVRGEAERTFTVLLNYLSAGPGGSQLEDIPGITFRNGADVIRNSNAPVIENLDDLPLPAFDLDPNLEDREAVHLEIGRGCPFACSFCSTNDFFRRNFRLKSSEKMIEQMKCLEQAYGIRNFSLIHDMYTVDRKKVMAFCEAVLACGHEFTWTCSARTDCIDDELIGLMARAGCRGIFFGIETGSSRLQAVIKKNLNLSEARERIECADDYCVSR
jgi:radical SAM superfamily enzyme YgiQ (UPF0313 family)